MVIRFFWTRAATVWLGVLYMVLGLLLLLFPDASGRLFVRSLAAGAVVYGVVHLWRYGQDRRETSFWGCCPWPLPSLPCCAP